MSILNVMPGELVTSAKGHQLLAAEINAALTAATPAVATMPASYGPVGAAFIAAIDEFHAALIESGTALVGHYQHMSEALNSAATVYASVDEASGAAISSSVGYDTTGGIHDTA